jgi:hypothetical protein
LRSFLDDVATREMPYVCHVCVRVHTEGSRRDVGHGVDFSRMGKVQEWMDDWREVEDWFQSRHGRSRRSRSFEFVKPRRKKPPREIKERDSPEEGAE